MPEQLKPGAFRVWLEIAKRYADHGQFYLGMDGALLEHYDFETPSDYPPPGCVVERWTGFYDDGGKPIYELDRCRVNGREGIVKQDKDSVSFRVCGCLLYNASRTNIEVIGTIHDSPETLAAAAKAVSQ